MLSDIYIKNYTVVEKLHLTLESGLSVLSGETGAGKSIIVDAVSLALGARADNKVVRQNADQCQLTLSFDISAIPSATKWLQQHDFAEESDCIIARTIHSDGRSRASINGRPAPLSLIRELASLLLVIHGQHQSQTLMQYEQQQRYVDLYAKNEPLLATLQDNFLQWRENNNQLITLKKQSENRDSQHALLTHQLQELEQLQLTENEWVELHQEHQKLHNASQLIDHLNQSIELTVENEQHSAVQFVQQALQQLNDIEHTGTSLDSVKEMLNTATIHIQEAGDELNQYRNTLDLSPERLSYIEDRLTRIHDLARKHHVNPEELIHMVKSLQQQLQQLESIESTIDDLEIRQKQFIDEYQVTANKLSKKRQLAAKEINSKITTHINQLGMKGGEFMVTFEKNADEITAHGFEKIRFHVKTNPGQNLGPMAKIVSGGELSRISLALQAIIAAKENTPTFIFDEVDVGIGGKTAEIVGKLIHRLAKQTQVFCITHLPQVASQGDQHYQVIKSSTQDSTSSTIKLLNQKERIQELARMISGSKISKETLAHAEQLLA